MFNLFCYDSHLLFPINIKNGMSIWIHLVLQFIFIENVLICFLIGSYVVDTILKFPYDIYFVAEHPGNISDKFLFYLFSRFSFKLLPFVIL